MLDASYSKLPSSSKITAPMVNSRIIESPRMALVPFQSIQQLSLPSLILPLLQENMNCSFIKSAEKQLFDSEVEFFEWTEAKALKLLNHWKRDTLVWILFKDSFNQIESNEETFPQRNSHRKSIQKTIHGGSLFPALSLKPKDKIPVGLACMSPSGSFSTKILTCMIRRKSRGKGYATEACKAILMHMLIPKANNSLKNLFDAQNPPNTELDSIVSLLGPNEPASWKRVLEKLGMTSDGSSIIYDSPTELFSINKEEFAELWSIVA